MRAIANKKLRAWLTLVMASAGLAVFTGAPASAAPVSIELCATTGTATLTGTVTVPIWGFGTPTTPGDCSTATATLPGPVLEVNASDQVTITLDNALPAGHALNFEIPGISFDPGLTDGSAPITFTASESGTYLYQSAGDAGRQEAMGLYGALVVRPGGASATNVRQPCLAASGTAYGNAFDRECVLVLSQVDPSFNALPDPNTPAYNMKDYLATYWLINGKAYPDTATITGSAGQNILLRYVNAGYDNTSMSLLGTHEHVVARDAYALNNPFDADAETIPAGGTEDAIVTVPGFAAPTANGFPLFNRNLHVTNGSTDVGNYATPGGMLTFITP